MNKKAWCIGLAALVIVIGTGCGQKPQAAPPQTEQTTVTPQKDTAVEPVVDEADQGLSNGSGAGQEAPSGSTSANERVQAQSRSIDVYYTDPDQTSLQAAERTITYTNELDKYKHSFHALQTSESETLIPLWGKIQLNSVSFEEGQLTLDITIPDTANLGSGGEAFALDALYQTFFQYDEVTAVDVLVEGQQKESLMGHVDLEHPKMK